MARGVALITGAGSGIGLGCARALAGEGYALALVGRDRARLESAAGGVGVPARVIVADLQDPRQAERMVDECVGHFGRLDALVNNAGWSPSATIAQTTAAIAERVFLVNAVAPTVAIARAWPIFERQARASGRPGVVVNVSSMAAVAEPYPILYAYAAAKAAVVSLARSVALQGAGIGVKGFAVAPGAVETPLLRTLVDEATLPRSKTLRPEDVASVIVDSVVGRRDRENGGVIALPSPG